MINRSFKFHSDGIEFGGYSIQVRNFSLNNIPRNLTRLATFSFSMAYAMGDVLGFRVNNEKNVALRIVTTPAHVEEITAAIMEGKEKCDMDGVAISYRNVQSDHHIQWCQEMGFGQTALRYNVNLSPFYYDFVTLSVDTSQGITQEVMKFERCLDSLVSNTITEIAKTGNTVEFSCGVAALGLFGMGYLGRQLYQARQNQNNLVDNEPQKTIKMQ